MVIKVDKSKCTLCGNCIDACPVEAMRIENEVIVDTARCIGCRMCLVSCPVKAITAR